MSVSPVMQAGAAALRLEVMVNAGSLTAQESLSTAGSARTDGCRVIWPPAPRVSRDANSRVGGGDGRTGQPGKHHMR
jgi:hypothetical protein